MMGMIRCRTCCMPDTRPDTPFIDGECSACVSHRKRHEIDWQARKQDLVDLLDRHHGRVIVPSSGGKDSTYQAITLKEMGADVTAVTARTCHLTRLGRANIDNLAKHVRTIEVVPNMTVRSTLNRLCLELVGDISWPEHAAIFSTPFRLSEQIGCPLIMYGENPQHQYGGPQGSEQAMQMTHRWVTEFGGFLGLRPADFIGVAGITAIDMQDYEPRYAPGTEAHFLGQYLPWDSQRNARIAQHNGMKIECPSPANWWSAENLDNAQTGIHDWFMWLKYGFGRGCQQISVDVREGLISRDDALKWIERHDGELATVYAGVNLKTVLDRLSLTPVQFASIAARFTNMEIHPCSPRESSPQSSCVAELP